MGSWSETCFVSQLPINEFQCRVVAVPIISHPKFDISEIWEPHAYYKPVGLPIRGVYDSYGGVEIDAEEEPFFEPLRKTLKATDPEVCHDLRNHHRNCLHGSGLKYLEPDVPYSVGGEQGFLSIPIHGTWEEGKFIHTPVYWSMMREEIYDYFMSYPRNEAYCLEQLKELYPHLHSGSDWSKMDTSKLDSYPSEDIIKALATLIETTHSPILQDLRSMHDYGPMKHYGFEPYLSNPDLEDAVLERFLDLLHLDAQLFEHRKVWLRLKGPQFGDYAKHEALNKVVSDLIQKHREEEA